MNKVIKSIVVLVLTAIFTVGAVLMIGPQIVVVVPVAIITGICFAFLRSYLFLVCFGYPLTFGFVSALIGQSEIEGYMQTSGFAISMVIGLIGATLVFVGLWKTLTARTEALEIRTA